MAININNDISYQLSLNVLKALGGNTDVSYETVDDIWDEINAIYDNAGDRLDIEALILDIKNNGVYEYYPTETADAYSPVKLNVNIPQKYTEEYIQELEKSVFQEGYNEGNEVGYRDGYTAGNTDGFTDGYAEGLDDGTEQQKALLSEVTVKENGVYEREDGYKKVYVEVDVPTFETETLSVELKENGTHTYTPTTDGFSSVEVSVNVDIPDVTPADLRNLIVEVNENKEYEFLPTDYDGWNKVNVTVNVPTGGGGDNPLSELGYSEDFISSVDSQIQRDITYTKTFVDRIDGKSGTPQAFNDYNLVYAPDGDASKITSLNGVFKDCRALTYIPPYNTTNSLINMGSMCENCYSLKKVGKFGSTSGVISATSMFYNCYSLEEIPDFDYSKITSGYNMFGNCYRIKNAVGLDFSGMTNSSNLFYYCRGLENVELNFPVTTTLDSAFKYCTSLKSIKITTSDKLTKCGSLFYGIPNAVIEPFNTSKVTDFSNMFYDSKVEYPPLLDTSAGTTFNQTFMYSSVIEIPAYDTSNNTTLYNTFRDCTKLTTIPELDCGKTSTISYMFGNSTNNCPALTNLGGFKDLGKMGSITNSSTYFLQACPNLTHESLMNVINGLYDRKSAGYSTVTLKFGSTNLGKLTDEEKAIATNKGWTLST